ncbi:lipoprotein [Spiroplasma culicicola]|uniref:Lipoprotein n=1 Tax=Spiroplasma culicicola AES-1 TaxID=1276246 RepID=W6A5F9_9MOLU|nr:lipoprotein [Spiroplasma culicicola]AHI52368.1 hypothetical protein SCULI_v1c00270 [Spiroplasma culicicola AES-1]
MKRLLAGLAAVTLTTSSVASVVACQTKAIPLEIKIDGFKYWDKETGQLVNESNENTEAATSIYDNAFTGKIASVGYQLLNAITFSDLKYADQSKLAEAKETIGEAGLKLSLDNLKDIETAEGDLEEFLASYTAPRNTNFTAIDFKTKSNNTFNIGDTPVFLVDRTYKENKLVEDKIVDGFDYESPEGGDWFSKLEDQNSELVTPLNNLKTGSKVSEWKDALGLTEEEFKEKLEKTNSGDDKLTDAETTQAKSFFTKMKDVSEKEVKLMGSFSIPTTINKTIVPADEEGQKNADEISNEWSLYSSTTGEGEDNGIKINTANTFVYNKGGSFADLELTFTDEEKEFSITYSGLNNIVLSYALNGFALKTGSGKEERTDKYVYWYEPYTYSFDAQKSAAGNKDIFNELAGFDPTTNITISKK